MVQGALHIAIITQLTSQSFTMTGPGTLGIEQVHDSNSPYHEQYPIPPSIDYQIQEFGILKMRRIGKSVLKELNERLMGHRRVSDWYMICLTIIVLLSNLEFIYRHEQRQREDNFESVSVLLRDAG